MKRRIILLGPPGSGKGTLGAQLKEKLAVGHVCSGHLLRQEVEKNSLFGKTAQPYIARGELVPDETVFAVMGNWLQHANLEVGFALDGFPRTVDQAKVLDGWLAERARPVELALLFTADLEETLERLAGRRSCPQCGRVYHVKRVPPRVAGRCDDCQTELVQRSDDRDSVLRQRFEVYRTKTAPLQDYYTGQGKLVVLDTSMEPERRFAAAWAALG